VFQVVKQNDLHQQLAYPIHKQKEKKHSYQHYGNYTTSSTIMVFFSQRKIKKEVPSQENKNISSGLT